MSIRLRLTLVILAVVAVMGVVSFMSFRLYRDIEGQVASLDRTSRKSLDPQALLGESLALEGQWDPRGFFLASKIERLPRSRRPKLRGSIEALDRDARSVTLYGRTIRTTEEAEPADDKSAASLLETLHVGDRVEVSCKIEPDGAWVARRLEPRGVKSSNKIKGMITLVEPASGPESAFSISGLAVRVPAGVEVEFPSGPLYRMETTTQMLLSIEEARAAAQTFVKQRYRERNLRARGERERAIEVGRSVGDAADRLEDAYESFAHFLAESRSAAEEEIRSAVARGRKDRAAAEEQNIELWLTPLEHARTRFDQDVHQLIGLKGQDPDDAQAFLQDVLEPALRSSIAPSVRSYLVETQERLAAELEAIAAHAASSARLAIAINIAGIALAVAAGLLLSRRISRPILSLGKALRQVGHGDLSARVEVSGRDEISELALAFNRMAEELSATTVSVARFENVIDSMAGALLILHPDGRIASVNPAALGLLGYQRDELVGKPFDVICAEAAAGESAAENGVTHQERIFRRKDGTPIPVSFSSATLRGETDSGGARVCLALDLTERKRMEEQLRRSLSEKALLLREVHHRVKNNMQVISSLLDLQSRSITDPRSLERFQTSQDRIRSMFYIHDQLYRANDIESVDLRAYIELLVTHLGVSHVEPPGRVRLRTQLDEMCLDLDRALACGLIVNELVTNALKHAFPEGASGEVVVSCRLHPEGTITLEVADDGRGFEKECGDGTTAFLGLSLVRTLVGKLHGEISSNGRAGASFRVEFPAGLAEKVA
ncbi:MAG: histidine kinase dimerization/phosphoacceptor domain -containing protein [Planctomycetota bacterium]